MMLIRRPLRKIVKVTVVTGLSLVMVCGLLFFLGMLAAPATAAPLALSVSGNITSDTTWDLSDSPIIVTGTVTVISGTLTIEPGVVVKFASSTELIIQTNGKLAASGTVTQPITFTSNLAGTSCDWDTIRLFSDGNTIQHSVIEYARWGIYIEPFSGGHTISSNTFRENGLCLPSPVGAAIAGSPDNTTIANNSFVNNNSALYVAKASANIVFNNEISGTSEAAIAFVRSGATLSSNNQVYSNTVHGSLSEGILLDLGFQNTISTNIIYNNTSNGLRIVSQSSAVVRHNDLYDNDNLGLYITGTNGLDLRDNLILDNTPGVLWDLNNTPGSATIARNVICRNPIYLFRNNDASSVTAAPNWWGSNTPGIGTEIQGPVVITPNMVLSATAGTPSLPANGVSTTTLTVSLQGGGETVPPRARAITLTTSLGVISPSVVTLDSSGIATAIYTAPITPGSAVITTTDICAFQVTTPVTLTAVYNLAITKTTALTWATPGQIVTYTIAYSNTSDQPAPGVVISDVLPAFSTYVGDTSGLTPTGTGIISWTVGTLPAHSGGAFVLTTAITNAATCNSFITNTVFISGTGEESSLTDNSSATTQQILCEDLQLSKEDNIACAIPGQLIDYTIAVTNAGPIPASSLLLTEFLPANTSFQGPVGGWTAVGGNVYTRSIGTLSSGQVDTSGFWVQVSPAITASAITNVVTLQPGSFSFTLTTPISTSASDLYVIKNDNIELLSTANAEIIARLEQKLGPLPWLEAVKTAGVGTQAISARPGDTISYTLAFGNGGTISATSVVITETLPDNTTFLGPAYWTAVNANTYVYTISTLSAGSGGNLDFRVRVDNPFPTSTPGVTNTVQIAGAGGAECDTSNNLSREFTPINGTSTVSTTVFLPIILKNFPQTPVVPTPTPTPLAYVSDVKADPDTNQVFIASPRHDWVYVIDGSSDTLARNVPVGNGPTGLTVLDASTAANNKVFVAHQYGANSWQPGFMAFKVNDTSSYATDDNGYAGAAPIKTAALASNSRVYVSNYYDKLAVFDGDSGPPETRLGWVVQKAFQGAYGIDTSTATGRVYLATRDTGELVVFDGNGDRLLGSNYIPTHVKPPQACSLWSVAVNETTGHVFVPCPQLGQVFVLEESQVSVLDLESLGTLEEREGYLALVVSPQAAPWLTPLNIANGTGLGEEGITVDSSTGQVYITNARNNTLVILQDGATPTYVTTVSVGTRPQGVDVNRATQKVYVGNTGSNSVTVLNGASPFSVVKTISLTP